MASASSLSHCEFLPTLDLSSGIAGLKHPEIWGESAITAWKEIWGVIRPSVELVMKGTAVGHYDGAFTQVNGP